VPASLATIGQKSTRCPGRSVVLSEGLRPARVRAVASALSLGKYPDFTFERFQGI
jgi:hypothetical protein